MSRNGADRYREYVKRTRIDPARARGLSQVTVRAGDVHDELSLKSRHRAVACALRTASFETLAGVSLMDTKGPQEGADTRLTYRVLPHGTQADSKVWYGLHVVAFLDVPGQQQKWQEIAELSADGSGAEDRLRELVSDAMRPVVFLREAIPKTMFQFMDDEVSADVPESVREWIRGARDVAFSQLGFSDSLVAWFRLSEGTNPTLTPITGLLGALYSIALTTLAGLRMGIPFRGGIDLGYGLSGLYEREVYGHALVSAYRLESRVAEWPRIVIGDAVWEYLSLVESSGSANRRDSEIAADRARMCRRLIIEWPPNSGTLMLHLLAPLVTRRFSPKDAARWVRETYETCRRAGNATLAGRYAVLLEYFRAHGHGE